MHRRHCCRHIRHSVAGGERVRVDVVWVHMNHLPRHVSVKKELLKCSNAKKKKLTFEYGSTVKGALQGSANIDAVG